MIVHHYVLDLKGDGEMGAAGSKTEVKPQNVDREQVKARLIRERLQAEEEAERQAEAARLEAERQSNNRKAMGEMTAWEWLSRASWEELCNAASSIHTGLIWSDLQPLLPGLKIAEPIKHFRDYIEAIVETVIIVHRTLQRMPPF